MEKIKNVSLSLSSRAQSGQPSFPSRTLSLLPGLRSPSLHVRQAQQASPPPLLSLSHRHLGPTCQASSSTRQRPPSLSLYSINGETDLRWSLLGQYCSKPTPLLHSITLPIHSPFFTRRFWGHYSLNRRPLLMSVNQARNPVQIRRLSPYINPARAPPLPSATGTLLSARCTSLFSPCKAPRRHCRAPIRRRRTPRFGRLWLYPCFCWIRLVQEIHAFPFFSRESRRAG